MNNHHDEHHGDYGWTFEEHKLFEKATIEFDNVIDDMKEENGGMQRFGKGDWKNISKFYVTTKTPTQVASHAQKFINCIHTKTHVEKRRRSINDIQFVKGSNSSTCNLLNHLSSQPNVPQNIVPPTFQHSAANNISSQSNHSHYIVSPTFQNLYQPNHSHYIVSPTFQNLSLDNINSYPNMPLNVVPPTFQNSTLNMPQNFVSPTFQNLAINHVSHPHVFPN
ncbi:hypothetical protein POM88_034926 [Heracleum sosnowskyi]|uniref:Uncharacterized protein n=1 Tax=Heracleum sosnowskyi TaxID=360622 RepID=A0AAD8HM34_9APIA|nr:hypothetical protein POM88_034926 [Heracleum sosnowskyi]